MAMLTGGMAEKYFISIFEHLAAMRKIKGPAALQMQGCWGQRLLGLWAEEEQRLSSHMAAPPESTGVMAASIHCCSLENSMPPVSELVNFAFFYGLQCFVRILERKLWLCLSLCGLTRVSVHGQYNRTGKMFLFTGRLAEVAARPCTSRNCLKQLIFSFIKTPSEMMEKVGSLTLLTRASCGTLQCADGSSTCP